MLQRSPWSALSVVRPVPLRIADCALWLLADGVYNNQAITTWTDRTANRYAFTGTGTFKTAQTPLSGPAIDFNGTSDQFKYSGALSSAVAGDAFFVIRFDTFAQESTWFSSSDESQEDLDSMRIHLNGVDPNIWPGIWYANSASGASGYNFHNNVAGNKLLINTWYIINIGYDRSVASTSRYSIRVNNVVTAVTVNTDVNNLWLGDISGRDNLIIGNRVNLTDQAEWHNGQIAEVLLYDRYLSAAERTLVHNYLSARHGITI